MRRRGGGNEGELREGERIRGSWERKVGRNGKNGEIERKAREKWRREG